MSPDGPREDADVSPEDADGSSLDADDEFRAVVDALDADRARALLDSDSAGSGAARPRWAFDVEALPLSRDGDLVIHRPDEEEAWLQSDTHVRLDERR